MSEPWCYIAHKNGYWAGVTKPGKDAGEFLAEFISEGFTITTAFSREDYERTLDGLKSWHKSPEYKAKNAPKRDEHPDLFASTEEVA